MMAHIGAAAAAAAAAALDIHVDCIFYFSWSKYCKELSEFMLLGVISLNIVLLPCSRIDGKKKKSKVDENAEAAMGRRPQTSSLSNKF